MLICIAEAGKNRRGSPKARTRPDSGRQISGDNGRGQTGKTQLTHREPGVSTEALLLQLLIEFDNHANPQISNDATNLLYSTCTDHAGHGRRWSVHGWCS